MFCSLFDNATDVNDMKDDDEDGANITSPISHVTVSATEICA